MLSHCGFSRVGLQSDTSVGTMGTIHAKLQQISQKMAEMESKSRSTQKRIRKCNVKKKKTDQQANRRT
jgi:hypothetical protein